MGTSPNAPVASSMGLDMPPYLASLVTAGDAGVVHVGFDPAPCVVNHPSW